MSGFGKITESERDMSEDGTWSNDYGTYHVWKVTIDADGKTIKTTVNRKVKDGSSKDPNGEDAELKNGKWKVAPPLKGEGSSSTGGGGKYEADPKKLRAENRRSALHAAISAAPSGTASGDIIKVAEAFHRYIEQDA